MFPGPITSSDNKNSSQGVKKKSVVDAPESYESVFNSDKNFLTNDDSNNIYDGIESMIKMQNIIMGYMMQRTSHFGDSNTYYGGYKICKEQYSKDIEDAVDKASQKYGVDKNLIKTIIKYESGGNPYAQSRCGAKGLMQLMDGTAKEMGVANSFDIYQNVDGGTKYIKKMLDRYHGDARLAVAAYNGGPGAIDKKGVGFCSENKNYVHNILG